MKLKNFSILIISPESWGVNFVSKHHYALELADLGSEVYFLNPPGKQNKVEEIRYNLKVIHYQKYLPGINLFPAFIREKIYYLLQKRILGLINKDKLDVVWSFDPFRFQNRACFNSSIFIYHPVDVHYTILENEIAKNADVIFSTADLVLDRFKGIPKPKFKINHGLAGHFVNPVGRKPVNVDPHKINIGLVGNLNYRFIDEEILIRIIRKNQQVNFYFIGPYQKSNIITRSRNNDLIQFISNSQNCILVGPVENLELPWLLQHFDAFLICYQGDRYKAEMANPHKVLEYLSTGKVIISHYIDEYKNQRALFEMVDDNAELVNKFSEVIENLDHYNQEKLVNARKNYAIENTYASHVLRIENILNSLIEC